jgi:dynein heavy chain
VYLLGHDEDGNVEKTRLIGVKIDDYNDGRYVVTYSAKFPGKYQIEVEFLGTFGGVAGPIRGSGVIVEFQSNAPRENNLMAGPLVIKELKSDVNYLQKFTEKMISKIFVRVKEESW